MLLSPPLTTHWLDPQDRPDRGTGATTGVRCQKVRESQAPSCQCCCCSVTKSCLPLFYSMDYSQPGSSIHKISQARILEWVAICFTRGIFQNQELNLHLLPGQILHHWSHQGRPSSTLLQPKSHTKSLNTQKKKGSGLIKTFNEQKSHRTMTVNC